MKPTWSCEEDEEDRVEEPDCVVDYHFVDNGRYQEGYQLNDYSFLPEGGEETVEVEVHVVVEPIVDHYVPLAVIGPKFD